MQAAWQDPLAEASSGWEEPSGSSAWNDAGAEMSVTNAQIESHDDQPAANQQDGDPNIIRCIAFYPYEVCLCLVLLLCWTRNAVEVECFHGHV